MEMTITDSEIKLAKQGAQGAYRAGRGLIDLGDLIGESNMWMVENYRKVVTWRDEGRHGHNKLRQACRQRCLTVIAKERKKRSGLKGGDIFFYNTQMVRELIADIFDVDDWTTSGVDNGELRGKSVPSEGGNKLAMVVDVRGAFYSLTVDDRAVIESLYRDGESFTQVAVTLDVAERTVRRKEERILEKIVERLGGESPFR